MEGEVKTYYSENIEILIGKLKSSLQHLYPIIEGAIDADTKDDKLFNVLKGKRQAAEDVEWTLRKINQLQNELDGKSNDEEENGEPGQPINHIEARLNRMKNEVTA